MTKINFTGVGDPLPVASYSAVVTKATYNPQSKNSGNPAVALEWTVNEGEYEGRKLFRSYSVQPNALVFLKQVLVALGIDPEDLSTEIDIDSVLDDILGSECMLDISIGEYNGSPNNQVDKVRPAGVGAF